MARYHINPETGEAGRCSAQIQCKFADFETGETPIHFANKAEANAYIEEKLASEMDEIPFSVKDKRGENSDIPSGSDMLTDTEKNFGIEAQRRIIKEKKEAISNQKAAYEEVAKAFGGNFEGNYEEVDEHHLRDKELPVHSEYCDCEMHKSGKALRPIRYGSWTDPYVEQMTMQVFDPKVKRRFKNLSGKSMYFYASKHDVYFDSEGNTERRKKGDPRGTYMFSMSTEKYDLNEGDVMLEIPSFEEYRVENETGTLRAFYA